MRLSTVLWLLALSAGALRAQEYFPPGVLGRTAQEHEFLANRYSRYLKALHEPSLWELSRRDPKVEVYRFLWLRSSHHPISVRLVVRASGSGWIHSNMTSGQGGHEPGRILRYSVSWLTKGKTRSFLDELQSADFWNLPALPAVVDTGSALDGAQWIVEGVKDGRYQVIDRRSPGSADPVRALGRLALKLGRFRLRPGEVY